MDADSEFSQLTDLEREVVAINVRGYTYRETATQLGMTLAELEASVSRVFEKLRVETRAQLSERFGDGAGGLSGVREPCSPSPSSGSGTATASTE
jgi:DNA-binding CsgD family transcriptional regulator